MKYLIIFLLMIGSVSAACFSEQPIGCPTQDTFADKIRDSCVFPDNGICEGAENPIEDKDCSINYDALSCTGNRCAFSEIWFAKILIISLLVMGAFYKKQYFPLIIFSLLVLFISFNSLDVTYEPTTAPGVDIPSEFINDNLILTYGYKISSSNPVAGFALAGLGLFLIVNYAVKKWYQ